MRDATTGLTLVPHAVSTRRSGDAIHLTSKVPLDPVARRTLDWLHHWAEAAPDRTFLAERSADGWREIAYGEALQHTRAIAASLISRGMGPETPLAVLSGNSVDHALLTLGAQYAGVPFVPLAEQYALIPAAHGRLIYVLEKVRPHLVFAEDAGRLSDALTLPQFDGVEIVASKPDGAQRPVTAFVDLLTAEPDAQTDARLAQVTPDTVAKILFTSGSSADPKGVLTTQRMLCANQAQIASVLPFLKERPPRISDWLPWNHVFGGSHNFNMMLANGGTLTIDAGKPVQPLFAETLRTLRDRPGTLSFNVPVGFALLVQAMRDDAALREAYFADLDMIFYAGASLPQDVWSALEEMAMNVRGRLPLMTSSWGMTETAPATVIVHEPIGRSGVIGVPMPGTEIKLVPDADMRCALHVKGPNIMPGYLDDPERTAEAFDAEGFLISGDAVRFVDVEDPDRGLVFDGRVSEDFKLATGTWVHASTLRLEALEALRGLVQDVVVCAPDRSAVGLLIFPRAGTQGEAVEGALLAPEVQAQVAERLGALAEATTGSARRITRALILAEPPSLKDAEVTDKGSLNVRKILTHRAGLVERLYDDADAAVIRV